MFQMKTIRSNLARSLPVFLFLGLVSGCSGTKVLSQGVENSDDYVEVTNPALTMSPNAPETIWVPRSYVEKGVPRGNELAKRGYEAVTGHRASDGKEAAHTSVSQTGIVGPGGKPAALIPHFGLVVAVEGEKVYFNLGREDRITQGQKLKVYRGGTVIEGLGLAPGEPKGTVEVMGFVGTRGGYGLVRQGGPVQTNDLIGVE